MAFELPTDCREIIFGGDSFSFPGWQRAWANTQMFRVSGLNDALASIGAARHEIQALNLIKPKINDRIPKEWREFFGPTNGAIQAWGPLGDPQINNHIQKSLPQIFDRALVSIVYVMVFVEEVLRKEVPGDFFEHVCVVPTPYSIAVEPSDFWETHVNGQPLAGVLADAVKPCPEFLVTEALQQKKRLTFRNAKLLRDALVDAGHRAEIVCRQEGKPHGAAREVLTESRKVAHPAVIGYMQLAG